MEKININEVRKIYLIGIGGIGISAIARFMKARGAEVSGSDLKSSEVTIGLEKIGIKVNYSQKEENISGDLDLVVYTSAVPDDNPELKKARNEGVRSIEYAEALGLIFNLGGGISVCGTHGKSTTSAMCGALLEDGGLDPTILVGSIVPRYNSNLRLGGGRYFVAESCEYRRHFLYLYPRIIVLNNIELDHTDYYKDIEDMRNAFSEFVSHLPEDGILVFNGDDENAKIVADSVRSSKPNVKIVSFGKKTENDIFMQNFRIENERSMFEVYQDRNYLGTFSLKVPGEFNACNALASIALGVTLGLKVDVLAESLENFSGIWRRFEIKGKYKNSLVISDYAHHPTAVANTIRATREFYPGKKIFVAFQPHQHNRTKNLYQDFLNCFSLADEVLLVKIYDVVGREEKEDQDVSSQNLANDVQKAHPELSGKVFYAESLEEAKGVIFEKNRNDDAVILIMGAGDIYRIADEVIEP